MGYYETPCQICHVYFNIARCRTRLEPIEAGWDDPGTPDDYSCGIDKIGCNINTDLSGCSTGQGRSPLSTTHFSGPSCTYTGAYSGLRIRANEMKGMSLPRYIVKRPDGMDVDGEAPEYEQRSDFFLTAQAVTQQDSYDSGRLLKVRYGVESLFPQFCDNGVDSQMETGFPVHASCWRIFERVSMTRLGRVELQGFMALKMRKPYCYCGFDNQRHDSIIDKCAGQWWVHHVGTEYLAANPYDIPALLLGLMSVYLDSQPGGSVVFANSLQLSHAERKENVALHNSTDPFAELPTEILTIILSHLSSKDIVPLRLASRSFKRLPQSLFLHLIRKELPWFWELDELKELRAKHRAVFGHDDNEIDQEEATARLEVERQNIVNVDWLRMYKKLIMLKKSILGVENRARIWEVAEELVEHIRMLRESLDIDEDDLIPYDLTLAEKEDPTWRDDPDCLVCGGSDYGD